MLEKFQESGHSSTEDFLRSVLDSSLHGIMTLKSVRDDQGEIIDFEWLFVNDVAEGIIGLKSSYLEGKHLLVEMPGNRDSGLFDKYKKVVETGNYITFEQYYPGEEMNRWFRISAAKLKDGFTVTFQDITDLKKMIAENENQAKKYQKLFEESIDAIFIVDETFNFVDANPAMEDLFHYDLDDLQCMSLLNLFHEKEEGIKFQKIMMDLRKADEFEATLIDDSQKKKLCLINCTSISDGKEQEQFLGVITDITKRKQAERELLMAEKLSMTGKIARTIAHEVRNPLNNLSLALEQLKDEISDDVADAELYFQIIQRNSERIGKLITNLLNSSKPKELKLEMHSINEQIKQTLSLVTDRLKLQNMKLEEKYDPDIPDIPLDTDQFNVALLNLFINAIEAMKPDKGVLSVSTHLEGQSATIAIKDNGKGISGENMDKLFEPFFTAKKDGTGLGLTMVQNVVHSHRGQIDVESIVGDGTTFYITFQV